MKKYKVNLYYSGFCTYEIEAESEDEAIALSRKMAIDKEQIVSNLESWKEADTAEEV